MSDFPELQHALVDAARRRHGRAPRTWRLMRPVAVAAACAAAAVALFLVARPGNDERSAGPGDSGALAKTLAVFQRPAGDADALPLSGAALERFGSGPGGAQLDVSQTRLVLENGGEKLYLVAARMLDVDGVCASLFRGDEEIGTVCGPVDPTHPVVATLPGNPDTVIGATPEALGGVEVVSELGGYGEAGLPDSAVWIDIPDRDAPDTPRYVMWGNRADQEQSVAPPLGTEDGPWPAAQCPKLEPLPPDALSKASRVGRAMARSQFPESLAIRVGPVLAQRGVGAPCGPAVAARTLSVPVTMQMNRSRREDSRRFATILVGQVNGRMVPLTSLGR
jgi:hypothetical protein